MFSSECCCIPSNYLTRIASWPFILGVDVQERYDHSQLLELSFISHRDELYSRGRVSDSPLSFISHNQYYSRMGLGKTLQVRQINISLLASQLTKPFKQTLSLFAYIKENTPGWFYPSAVNDGSYIYFPQVHMIHTSSSARFLFFPPGNLCVIQLPVSHFITTSHAFPYLRKQHVGCPRCGWFAFMVRAASETA